MRSDGAGVAIMLIYQSRSFESYQPITYTTCSRVLHVYLFYSMIAVRDIGRASCYIAEIILEKDSTGQLQKVVLVAQGSLKCIE